MIPNSSEIISAAIPWLTRLYCSSSSGGNGVPGPWMTVAPMATRLMLSTPAAMVMSQTPDWMRLAAKCTACCDEPH